MSSGGPNDEDEDEDWNDAEQPDEEEESTDYDLSKRRKDQADRLRKQLEEGTKTSAAPPPPPPPAKAKVPVPVQEKPSAGSKGKMDLLAAIRKGTALKAVIPPLEKKPVAKSKDEIFKALLAKVSASVVAQPVLEGAVIERKLIGYTTHLSKEEFQEKLSSEFGAEASFTEGDFIPVYAGQENQFNSDAESLEIDLPLTKTTLGKMQFWPLEAQQGFKRESPLTAAPIVASATFSDPLARSLPEADAEFVTEIESFDEASLTDEQSLPDEQALSDAQASANESLEAEVAPEIPDILAASAAQMPAFDGDQVTLISASAPELNPTESGEILPPAPPPRSKESIKAARIPSSLPVMEEESANDTIDLFSAKGPTITPPAAKPREQEQRDRNSTTIDDFLTATPPLVRFEPVSKQNLSNFELLTQSIKSKIALDPSYYNIIESRVIPARQSVEMGLDAKETFSLRMKTQPPSQPHNYEIHIQDNNQTGVDFYVTHTNEESLNNICKMAIENAVPGMDFSNIHDKKVEDHLRKAIMALYKNEPEKVTKLNLSINGEIVKLKPRRLTFGSEGG